MGLPVIEEEPLEFSCLGDESDDSESDSSWYGGYRLEDDDFDDTVMMMEDCYDDDISELYEEEDDATTDDLSDDIDMLPQVVTILDGQSLLLCAPRRVVVNPSSIEIIPR